MKKILPHLKNFILGALTGALMMIPGVSGGTVAIILGVYDQLVKAVATFTKDIKKNLLFLGAFGIGGIVGVVAVSKLLLWLVGLWEVPMMFLFIGAPTGSVPLLIRKSKTNGFHWSSLVALLAGLAIVIGVSLLPEDLFVVETDTLRGFLLLLALGIPLAIPLVLPGISFSYMLMVFAIYTRFLAALSSIDIMFLLPLCLGLLIGMIAFTKLLDKAMSQKPGPTYYCITGFVLGSIIMLAKELPHWPTGWEIPACVVTFIVGAVGVYLYSRKAE